MKLIWKERKKYFSLAYHQTSNMLKYYSEVWNSENQKIIEEIDSLCTWVSIASSSGDWEEECYSSLPSSNLVNDMFSCYELIIIKALHRSQGISHSYLHI